jgi:hypothetical protein
MNINCINRDILTSELTNQMYNIMTRQVNAGIVKRPLLCSWKAVGSRMISRRSGKMNAAQSGEGSEEVGFKLMPLVSGDGNVTIL